MLISYFPTSECVPVVRGSSGTEGAGDHAAGGLAAGSVVWPDAAVVIDVLRATTTIAWSLANGAEAIQAFADLAELETAARAWPADKGLRAGERGGKRLEGFDLGNSPLAVTPAVVAGKRLFMSTTNGTRSLDRVRPVGLLVTACLPNHSAVAQRLLDSGAQTVWIVGSGWEGDYSLEDSLAAGAVAAAAINLGAASSPQPVAVTSGNDEMLAALALWQHWRHDPEACLRASSHGQRLIGLGDHDADFRCCAALDSLTVVPTQTSSGVLEAR